MKLNEVRVGNLVYQTFEETYPHIIYIDSFNYIDSCTPIEIMDRKDWLLFFKEIEKSGGIGCPEFYNIGEVMQYGVHGVVVCADSGYGSSFTYTRVSHIKYIHQLQNLYYDLTGNELTLDKEAINKLYGIPCCK